MLAPFLSDPDVTLYHGDALSVLRGLPDGSVHCCVTSPPYWGLRDYGAEGQLGLEATPDAYVEAMVAVFREVRRVLRPDGTLWLNLGDSYARPVEKGERGPSPKQNSNAGTPRELMTDVPPGLKQKDMCGIPWRVAFALQADGWYLRSDIIWAKPNPMPESVTDRPTKSHEYVFLLSKGPRYFFDQEAVRERYQGYDGRNVLTREAGPGSHENHQNGKRNRWPGLKAEGTPRNDGERWNEADGRGFAVTSGGRNVRSVWSIATQPYPNAHFATFPEELARRCILAGTSERGCCPVCGAPLEREIARGLPAPEPNHRQPPKRLEAGQAGNVGAGNMGFRASRLSGQEMARWKAENPDVTAGWRPSCDHDRSPVPCTVLDPFGGSGTTALVARKHQRRTILIELSEPYCELASRRLAQQSLLAVEAS